MSCCVALFTAVSSGLVAWMAMMESLFSIRIVVSRELLVNWNLTLTVAQVSAAVPVYSVSP